MAKTLMRRLLLCTVIAVGACSRDPQPKAEAPSQATTADASPQPSAVALPPPALERGDLLDLVDQVVSAFASGAAYPEAAAKAAGRRFEIALPFGCRPVGPAGEASWDADRGVLKLSVRPEDWSNAPWRPILADERAEAVEGLWVHWPWIRPAVCPISRGDDAVTATSQPSVGLAQVYGEGASRLGRREGRAWTFSGRRDRDSLPLNGFRLVVSGRLAEPENGQPVRCWSRGIEARPTCFLMVEVDRARFETGDGEVVSEWGR